METQCKHHLSLRGSLLSAAGLVCSFGSASAALPAVQPLEAATASIYGSHELDQSGYRVVAAGDLNGDGFGDIAISSPGASQESGEITLFFGRSTGLKPGMDTTQANVRIRGENVGDMAGLGLASAGDLNSDGLADLVVGAPFQGTRGYGSGKVYVFFGKRSGWASVMTLAEADASFLGEASLALTGFSLAGIGDVNKDGFADLAIGAHGMNSNAGKVYIVLGGAASAFSRDMELGEAASLLGEAPNDYAGFSLAGAGDLNRDGYADLIIGAYGNSEKAAQAGKVYLVYGGTGWSRNAPLSQIGSSFTGQAARDYAGYSVAGVGDVNGDARADFVIGAPGRDEAGEASGLAAVVYGRSAVFGRSDLSQANARLIGMNPGDNVGAALAPIGDVDRDGFRDLLISAHNSDEAAQDAGATYLVRGSLNGLKGTISLSTASTRFLGEAAYDSAGWSVAGGSDIDGDGYSDILISAYASDAPGVAAGATYFMSMGGLVDSDRDGFTVGSGDCNDLNPEIHPGAREIPGNGIDEDCRPGDGRGTALEIPASARR